MCRFADAHLQSGVAALHFLLRVIISTRQEFSIPLSWGTDMEVSWASVSISVQPRGCTANTSMSAFSMCGPFSAAAAALLTLLLKDRKVTLEHPLYSCELPLCLFSTPLTISHPIFPSPSDAHSRKTPSYCGITGLICVCIYCMFVCFYWSLLCPCGSGLLLLSLQCEGWGGGSVVHRTVCVCEWLCLMKFTVCSVFLHCSFLLHLLLHLK